MLHPFWWKREWMRREWQGSKSSGSFSTPTPSRDLRNATIACRPSPQGGGLRLRSNRLPAGSPLPAAASRRSLAYHNATGIMIFSASASKPAAHPLKGEGEGRAQCFRRASIQPAMSAKTASLPMSFSRS